MKSSYLEGITSWEYHPAFGIDTRLIGRKVLDNHRTGDFHIEDMRREYREHVSGIRMN